ncbi:MAG: hypothetical protein R3F43_05265 [bacterium]
MLAGSAAVDAARYVAQAAGCARAGPAGAPPPSVPDSRRLPHQPWPAPGHGQAQRGVVCRPRRVQ